METRSGLIEIDLADGMRLRVDAFVNERALRRVLSATPRISDALDGPVAALVADCLAPAPQRPDAATVADRIDALPDGGDRS